MEVMVLLTDSNGDLMHCKIYTKVGVVSVGWVGS